jgi:hypothetical protein
MTYYSADQRAYRPTSEWETISVQTERGTAMTWSDQMGMGDWLLMGVLLLLLVAVVVACFIAVARGLGDPSTQGKSSGPDPGRTPRRWRRRAQL